jgi:uncharacterized protein
MEDPSKKSIYEYGQFTPEHWGKLAPGLGLFNDQKFWECHEYLEDHWLEDVSDPARLIYWAVIQTANALFHWREKNLSGASGQLKKAIQKIERAERQRVETPFLFHICNWQEFKDRARRVEKEGYNAASFESLENFKFIIKR